MKILGQRNNVAVISDENIVNYLMLKDSVRAACTESVEKAQAFLSRERPSPLE